MDIYFLYSHYNLKKVNSSDPQNPRKVTQMGVHQFFILVHQASAIFSLKLNLKVFQYYLRSKRGIYLELTIWTKVRLQNLIERKIEIAT